MSLFLLSFFLFKKILKRQSIYIKFISKTVHSIEGYGSAFLTCVKDFVERLGAKKINFTACLLDDDGFSKSEKVAKLLQLVKFYEKNGATVVNQFDDYVNMEIVMSKSA